MIAVDSSALNAVVAEEIKAEARIAALLDNDLLISSRHIGRGTDRGQRKRLEPACGLYWQGWLWTSWRSTQTSPHEP